MQWQLQTEEGQPVELPLETVDSRGETATIQYGRPPHRPGSTGRVYTQGGGEYFPSVFKLQWVELPGSDEAELKAAMRLMGRIGGSFSAALAAAYRVADSDNRARILAGWPDLIGLYRRIVRGSTDD